MARNRRRDVRKVGFSKLTREHFRRELIFVRQVHIAELGTMPDRVVAEYLGETQKSDSTEPSPTSLPLLRRIHPSDKVRR
jgi:hypothetical protein